MIQGMGDRKSSFSNCTARFAGERDNQKVDEFITTVGIYRDIKEISDADTIKSMPLLLTNHAATWWQGIKHEAVTWTDVTKLLRNAFAPSTPAYRIYLEIFQNKQLTDEATDDFICRKRALFAQLPEPTHPETVLLDFVYGLLHLRIRERLPRETCKTFKDLLREARTIEHTLVEKHGDNIKTEKAPASGTGSKPKPRCTFCKYTGHTFEECRKRQRAERDKPQLTTQPLTEKVVNVIHCYQCKKPGYYRSNCPSCSPPKETQSPKLSFNCLKIGVNCALPTIPISVHGESGVAYLDTAARTSVAGRHLMIHLIKNGTKFIKQLATIKLADGTTKTDDIFIGQTVIVIGNRLKPITMMALPKAENNRTLIGVDFLEQNGIVLNLAQRYWFYEDDPKTRFNFYENKSTKVTDAAALQNTMDTTTVMNLLNVNHPQISSDKSDKPVAPPSAPEADNLFGPITPWERSSAINNDYSPHSTQAIFKDCLPSTESTPEPLHMRHDLFPAGSNTRITEPQSKKYRLNESDYMELNSIDVTLRPDEGMELKTAEKSQLNKL